MRGDGSPSSQLGNIQTLTMLSNIRENYSKSQIFNSSNNNLNITTDRSNRMLNIQEGKILYIYTYVYIL